MQNGDEFRKKALLAMSQDDYVTALGFLKHCTDLLSSIDIASCYYMLNDFPQFHRATLQAKALFEAEIEALPTELQIHSSLGLGKLLEELACLDEALQVYSKVATAERIQSERGVPKLRAQLLRVASMLGNVSEAEKEYQVCEQFRARDSEAGTDVEHALMLSDFLLLNKAEAKKRLLTLLSRASVKPSEKRLLIFDFLFEALRTSSLTSADLEILKDFEYARCDAFEKVLWDLAEGTHVPDFSITGQLSPMCGFRYLYLIQKLFPACEDVARQKFVMLSKTLTKASAKLVLKAFPLEASKGVAIQFDMTSKILRQGERALDLSSHSAICSLLMLFQQSSNVACEEAIRNLFGGDADFAAFERLRKSVDRANNSLATFLTLPKALSLTKSELKVDSKVALTFRR